MKKKFEFLPHTADVKFRAYGKTLEEAFANAALATTAVMTEDTIKTRKEKKVSIISVTKEALLYDFLEKLIYFVDTEGFLVGGVKHLTIVNKGNAYQLVAVLLGDSADTYDVSMHIKAVTYSDMFIKEEKTGVTIQVVHDI